ncbi:hypothetical protein FACS189481_4390 [Clostridia bacterium]|nr:hypothetical protein FACS189481_4390 [Clostridia bacterium]
MTKVSMATRNEIIGRYLVKFATNIKKVRISLFELIPSFRIVLAQPGIRKLILSVRLSL